MLPYLFFLPLCLVSCIKIYVLFGPSQSGKSSFINALSEIPDLSEEGTGAGISQTTTCKEYFIERDGQEMLILDAPGLGDNLLNTPDEETMNQIRGKVMDHLSVMILESGELRKTIDGILIFESLEDDFTRLKQTLSNSLMLFGHNMNESAVVIFTKGDLEYSRRAERCASLSSCSWESKKFENDQYVMADHTVIEENWVTLKAILNNLAPYEVARMEQVFEEISALTRKLWQNQPVEYETIRIPVKRQIQTGESIKEETHYKPPETRYEVRTLHETKRVLVSRARSHADLKRDFLNRFLQKYHIFSRNCPHSLLATYHTRPTFRPEAERAAHVCADIFMVDYSAKDTYDHLDELEERYPNANRDTMYIWWRDIIENSRDFGCGVDMYREEAVVSTVNIPYQYSEPYIVTIASPVFEQVEDVEEKEVQKPLKTEIEFGHIANKSFAESIRENLRHKE